MIALGWLLRGDYTMRSKTLVVVVLPEKKSLGCRRLQHQYLHGLRLR
jgi:hypothetical protein